MDSPSRANDSRAVTGHGPADSVPEESRLLFRPTAMTIAILSLFVLGAMARWVARAAPRSANWLLALVPFAWTVYFLSRISSIGAGNAVVEFHPWVPALGVNFSFYLDGLSLVMALLITGIGTLVIIYAGGYLAGHPQLDRMYAYLLVFMASMLGVVLADNAVTLFVFWELTSVSSYLLIGFDHERAEARSAALQALLVTGLGGLPLLAGLLLLGMAGGNMEISALLAQGGGTVRAHPLYLPILLLILAGAFTKSAQFPFHFWLPNAMEAPTPVSAYLHAATMVKAGVYLLARLNPVLGGTEAWTLLVGVAGAVTMALGAYLAFRQTDLKRLLAYSTVSALGTLTLLLGLGTEAAAKAAVIYLLAHGFYKGAMFLMAGAVDHETGTRHVTELGGLRAAMPVTAAAAFLAALSMAGLPPAFGFIAKEGLLEAVHDMSPGTPFLVALTVISGMLGMAVAALAGLKPFIGPPRETPKHPHEAPLSLWLGPALLAGLGLFFGFVPGWLEASLLGPAASAVAGAPVEMHLALWHGFNPVLALSGVTVAGGAGLYWGWGILRGFLDRLDAVAALRPSRWYDWGLNGMLRLATAQTRVLQNGYLRHYLRVIVLAAVAAGGYTLFSRVGWPGLGPRTELRPYEALLGALILLAAVVAVRSRSRLAAIASLGVVGYGVALVYVLFGAPDLAMTQILVETLTVILFVFMFYHLPRFAELTSQRTRARDIFVSLSAGALVTLLVLAATSAPLSPRLTPYFASHSLESAHGRNIVNVILVDFRALDTLGEITVLAVAGVGVFALLKLRMEKGGGT
jgi:multicomponent Na+:H+ antiporter subunit A